jgi:hypothetical protein
MRLAKIAACLLAATALNAGSPALADDLDPLDHFAPLSDAELADARGGFEWGGMSISFGADMQTYLNGQLALHTVVSWTPTGASTQTTAGSFLSASSLAALQANGPAGLSLPAILAGSPVYTANAGQTAIVQGANAGLQNILVNGASNLNAFQQTNATVAIANYGAFASAMRAGMIGTAISREIGAFAH